MAAVHPVGEPADGPLQKPAGDEHGHQGRDIGNAETDILADNRANTAEQALTRPVDMTANAPKAKDGKPGLELRDRDGRWGLGPRHADRNQRQRKQDRADRKQDKARWIGKGEHELPARDTCHVHDPVDRENLTSGFFG